MSVLAFEFDHQDCPYAGDRPADPDVGAAVHVAHVPFEHARAELGGVLCRLFGSGREVCLTLRNRSGWDSDRMAGGAGGWVVVMVAVGFGAVKASGVMACSGGFGASGAGRGRPSC